ncbi:MAG: hypothetical protein ABI361_09805 [Nitrososphaera sp.]|jgi:hypothetical protein
MRENSVRLAITLACAALLVAGVASNGFTAVRADAVAAKLSQKSGNYIINYIYEIDVGKNLPRLAASPSSVAPGNTFEINGTNFKPNSTAKVDIFAGNSVTLQRSNGSMSGSAAILLSSSNLTLARSASPVVENAPSGRGTAGNGTVFIVTKISTSDLAPGNYHVSLTCAGDNQTRVNETAADPLVTGSSAKQFFRMQLPAGKYSDCNIDVMSAGGSSTLNARVGTFDVAPNVPSGVLLGTGLHGEYLKQAHVDSGAHAGSYVLLAQGNSSSSGKPLRAIAPLAITTTANGNSQSASSSSSLSSNFATSMSQQLSTSTGQGQNSPSANQNKTNQPGNPGPTNHTSGSQQPACASTSSSFSKVINNEKQLSSQTSSNNSTNDAVVTVVQKISGSPNGAGAKINNNVLVSNTNTVTQHISQSISQHANIENCGSDAASNSGPANLTNSIFMNSTQDASNIFSDDATIIIMQTIIVPKSCDTTVDAGVTVNNNNNVKQQITQSINQDANIYYGSSGGSGSGTYQNSVTQVSIQVSNNTSANRPIYNVNQVIIVPEGCPAIVSSPVVVNNVNNVTESISQVSNQNATVYAGVPGGGLTILSSVSNPQGQSSLTNTITAIALQNATNSFTNNPTVTIQQKVYYVGNTTGWDASNYQSMLAKEFANENGTGGSAQGPAAHAQNSSSSTTNPGQPAAQSSAAATVLPKTAVTNSTAPTQGGALNVTASQTGPPVIAQGNNTSTASTNSTSSPSPDHSGAPYTPGGPNKPQGS